MPEAREYNEVRRWLIAVILLGIVVRFVGLTQESFWNDEAFSGYAAQFSSLKEVLALAAADVHPPGHLIFGWLWAQVFGASDFSLRCTSAIGGTLLIPTVFALGRRFYDERTALVGATLMAFLTQTIYYSQEFRAYIFVGLLSAISVLLLYDIFKGVGRLWQFAALAATLIANAYLHYFGLLFSVLIGFLFIAIAARTKRHIFPSTATAIIAMIAYVPWLPEMAKAPNILSHPVAPGLREIGLLSNVVFGPGWILVGLAGALLVAGFWYSRTNEKESVPIRQDLWLLAWILIPLAISIIVSYVKVPVYTPRNLFLAITPAVLLMARAICGFRPELRRTMAITVGFLVLHQGIQLSTKGHFIRPQKQELREATQYILARMSPADAVEVVGWDYLNVGYYLRQSNRGDAVHITPLEPGKRTGVPVGNGPWLFYAGLEVPPRNEIERRFEILEEMHFREATVLKVRRRNAERDDVP